MKIYCICAWDQYYPEGGSRNIKAAFLNYENALEAFEKFNKDNYDYCKLEILFCEDCENENENENDNDDY